jgi:hypothetical protein
VAGEAIKQPLKSGHKLENRIIAWGRNNNPSQGCQFRKQTFEDDVEVNMDEIRELLDMGDDCDEAGAGYVDGSPP